MPAEANSVFRRRSARTPNRRQQRNDAPGLTGQNNTAQSADETNRDAESASAYSPSSDHGTRYSGSYNHPPQSKQTPVRSYDRAYPPVPGVQAVPYTKSDWLDSARTQAITDPIDTALAQWRGQLRALFTDQVTPVRLASHLSVLVVAALILIISQLDIPDWQFSLRALPSTSFLGANVGGGMQSNLSALLTEQTGSVFSAGESLQRATVPFTVPNAKPEPEAEIAGAGGGVGGEIQKYTVQPGDTVLGIAERFGLQPETVQWANSTLEINPDLIRPGDELNILPINGVLHTIRSGDTLSSIARNYTVEIDDIIGFQGNGLASVASPLSVGRQLVIPNGTKQQTQQQVVTYTSSQAPPTNARVGSGNFVWPSSGPINQRYWSGHPAVDIGGWTGAPVRAADGGYVAVARGGWNGGYGNHVIIDHGNGFVTLYAHLNSLFVKPGESVSRGQQVGSVGNTGNSTGPHLHFEIRYQGVSRNPLSYLP